VSVKFYAEIAKPPNFMKIRVQYQQNPIKPKPYMKFQHGEGDLKAN